MNKVTIQVPVDKTLKASAEKVASEYGFSSLQEAIRLFMAQFANKSLNIGFFQTMPDEILTQKEEAVLIKKYTQAKKQIKKGKGFSAYSPDEMLSQLRS